MSECVRACVRVWGGGGVGWGGGMRALCVRAYVRFVYIQKHMFVFKFEYLNYRLCCLFMYFV